MAHTSFSLNPKEYELHQFVEILQKIVFSAELENNTLVKYYSEMLIEAFKDATDTTKRT